MQHLSPTLFTWRFLISGIAGFSGLFLFAFTADLHAAAAVDYRRDIQPILSEHCLHCHGTDEADRKGALRLDVREAALKGGEADGPAITPGKPDESAIMARILSDDPDEIMPPPKAKNPLSAAQKAALKQWIADGAPYARHWAFDAPKRAAITSGTNAEGIHPVDALIRQKLATVGLKHSEPADARALCRRLHLDLTGLPPSPPELDAFVAAAAQNRPQAVTETIERLMKNPQFGEKWARVWLDAARYSDSNGYEKDLPREQWVWRDWVVKALNDDMPYDRFVVEQLAGDLLPGATQDQIIATGFLRNGMVNEEGAIVAEQFRMEGVFDRMDCVGKAVIGLSLQCAQCHTHKFDPITHTEYYGIFAFLNNTHEAQSWVYTDAQKDQIAKVQKGIDAIDVRVKKAQPQWKEEMAAWETSVRQQQAEWETMVPTEMLSKSGLNHPTALPDRSVLTLGHPSTKSDIYIIGTPKIEGITGIRLEALMHQDLPFGGPGFSRLGTWALTELEVHTQLPGTKEWVAHKLKNATADFAEADHRIEEHWHSVSTDKERNRSVGPVPYMIDGSDMTGFRADRGPGRRNQESVAVAQFEAPVSLPEGTKFRVMLRTNHGGDDNGRSNVMLGRCRISLTRSPDPKAAAVDYAAILAMGVPAGERTEAQQRTLFAAWRAATPATQKFEEEARKLWKQYPEAGTSVLHLAERKGEFVRATHLLDRGAWDRPKQPVEPHVLGSLHTLDAPSGQRDRLAFARWITDKSSPLTARVAVNRIWQNIFGMGIVETAEDFGTRTLEPEHREVLDWLAVDFMEHGWSQKHIIRTILQSATYQQSAKATPELLERDPRNVLLARGPRFRVDAEVIRDIALSASGLLHHQLGGPSVFPPVPASVIEFNFSKPNWEPATDAQRYRRSLYLFRKRSMPDPVMSAFDAPNGDFACARRPRSNTPLAALTGLNEPVFVEAAQAFAIRVWREGGADDASRIDYAFRLCLSREPRAAEQQLVLKQLQTHRERLRSGELNAPAIAFSAFAKASDLPSDATPNDLAAWTLIGRVLLNLDETLTK